MVQWIHLNRNNSFVNPRRLPLLCGIPGAVHLVLVGLMAGRVAGRLADKIQVNFKIFKIRYRSKCSSFASFNRGTTLKAINACCNISQYSLVHCSVQYINIFPQNNSTYNEYVYVQCKNCICQWQG